MKYLMGPRSDAVVPVLYMLALSVWRVSVQVCVCVCVCARVLNSGHIVSDNYLTAGSLQTSLLSGFSIIVLERECASVHVHECECTGICVYVCMYVCMCVCVCVRTLRCICCYFFTNDYALKPLKLNVYVG